jgi:hypothetical protein
MYAYIWLYGSCQPTKPTTPWSRLIPQEPPLVEQTHPWNFGHVSGGFCHCLSISGSLRSPCGLRASPFWGKTKNTRPWICSACILCTSSMFMVCLGLPNRHRTTPLMTTTTTNQQPPRPTATSKQTRTGAKYPVRSIPPHSDIIYMYIQLFMCTCVLSS